MTDLVEVPESAYHHTNWTSPKARHPASPRPARTHHPSSGLDQAQGAGHTDPVEGGSANDYDYLSGDPLNAKDLDGRWDPRKHLAKHWKTYAGAALSFVPVAGQLAWAYRGYRAYRFLSSSGRVGTALSKTRAFGYSSRLFGDAGRTGGRAGVLQRKKFRMGWSARSGASLGIGIPKKMIARPTFRVGIGSLHFHFFYSNRW